MIFFQGKVNFPEKWKVFTSYYITVTVCVFWLTCLFTQWHKDRMAGVGGHLWSPIQSAHKGLKCADCPVSFPVKFWISSGFMKEINIFMKERNTFFQGYTYYWSAIWVYSHQISSTDPFKWWNCLFSSILPLCWVGPLFNTISRGRSTLKMLLINMSCTEQIFAYQRQIPAGLCFDFGINLELMS